MDYAAAVALELHAGATTSDEPTVNFRFKNGTTDGSFHDLPLFGSSSVPLSQFISQLAVCALGHSVCYSLLNTLKLQPSAVNSTEQWCTVCNQKTLRGCSVFNI